jgi:hypothetical protein
MVQIACNRSFSLNSQATFTGTRAIIGSSRSVPLCEALVGLLKGRLQLLHNAMVAGGAELVAAWYGAAHGGLTNLAWCLAAVMVVEGVLMAPTVLRAAFGRTVTASCRPVRQ